MLNNHLKSASASGPGAAPSETTIAANGECGGRVKHDSRGNAPAIDLFSCPEGGKLNSPSRPR
jgi:hypothetical protein